MRRSILSSRHLRTSTEGTGGGGGTQQQTGQQGTGQQQQAGDQGAGGSATTGATGEKGFPENTPVADMTIEQQLAYTRYHSHKHESLANQYRSLGDIETVKAKIAAAEAAEAAKLTPSEQAVNEARAAGKAEAMLEANSAAATAILEANLVARGKSAEEIADILGPINASAFIADGKVDTAKVLAFANRVAGPADGTTTTTRQRLDMGQGNRGNRTTATGVDAGRELYAASRGKQKTT